MNTFSRASLFTFALVGSALLLGGCAATADDVLAEADTSSVEAASLGTPVVAPTQPIQLPPFVAPACRAVLVSTGPAIGNGPNAWGCAPADPYTAQRRFSGEVEGGLTELRDEAQFGKLTCGAPKNALQPICTKATDRLIERTCTETRIYECPCGVENVTVEGGLAASCRRVPR